MEKIIKFSNTDIPLSLYGARVIHANKYSETHGGAFNFPVSSTLYTDVVFRLTETGEDIKTYIKNLDLPIYNEQEVTVICSGKKVIGFIDVKTNYYYYTTKNFSRLLGIGISFIWVWILGLLGGLAIYSFYDRKNVLLIIVPLLAVYAIFLIYKWILDYRIQKEIDIYLQ